MQAPRQPNRRRSDTGIRIEVIQPRGVPRGHSEQTEVSEFRLPPPQIPPEDDEQERILLEDGTQLLEGNEPNLNFLIPNFTPLKELPRQHQWSPDSRKDVSMQGPSGYKDTRL